ncbi:unnamed protein product [Hymenolepis diminuta]|uniref:Uncharacterized protein n=1 Tax=Hymenolepis diminuta TaxID=6216 RepID=A0A0R3SDA5_HYMDI|nr:unnamed protein product [Hymenolepis diminuta]
MGSVNSKSSRSRSFKIPAIELAENSTRHNAIEKVLTPQASPRVASQKYTEDDTASMKEFLILERFSEMECGESDKHLNHSKEDEIELIQKDRNNSSVKFLRRTLPITSSGYNMESLQMLKPTC